jgi:hypothetical protein
LHTLSKNARLIAEAIKTCIAVDQGYQYSDSFIIGNCLSEYVRGTASVGKVVEEIHFLREELAKDGMVIAQLEGVVRRVDNGPDKEELKHGADVLNQLYKALDTRAQSEH